MRRRYNITRRRLTVEFKTPDESSSASPAAPSCLECSLQRRRSDGYFDGQKKGALVAAAAAKCGHRGVSEGSEAEEEGATEVGLRVERQEEEEVEEEEEEEDELVLLQSASSESTADTRPGSQCNLTVPDPRKLSSSTRQSCVVIAEQRRKSSFWIGPKLPAKMGQNRSSVGEIRISVDTESGGKRRTASPQPLTSGGIGLSHRLNNAQRRESFLYRCESEADISPISGSKNNSRQSSITSEYYWEENFVTPFAQVLAGLKNVRNNFVHITNLPQRSKKVSVPSAVHRKYSHYTSGLAPDDTTKVALETLDELDWCLEQLENIKTRSSVSEMAASKFQKLLSKELSQLSGSKYGDQISRYIFDTFTASDSETKLDLHAAKVGEVGEKASASSTGALTPAVPPPPPQHVQQAQQEPAQRRIAAAVSRICKPTKSKKQLISGYGVETDDPESLAECLGRVNSWGLDVFRMQKVTKNRVLTAVAYALFKERGLIKTFSLNPLTVLNFFSRLEDRYRPNPYHNSMHAADVAQSTHVLLSSQALNNVFTDLEILAAIFASAVHDVDHPGVTNQYLVNTGSELAILYNDESVLEQHHLAVSFKLLSEPDLDFVNVLNKKQRQTFRRIVIDMVMATDMSKHMGLLADFKTTVETKKIAGSGSGVLLLENYSDRIQVLQNIIHLCDLSNPTKPLNLYTQWTDRITEEFFRQGDKERQLGIELSPICDRHNANVEKSQVGFIDYIVHPLWETWAEFVYPDAQALLEQLEQNRLYYNEKVKMTPEQNTPRSPKK